MDNKELQAQPANCEGVQAKDYKEFAEFLKMYCSRCADLAKEMRDKCYDEMGHGASHLGSCSAFAYFDRQYSLLRYDIPGIIEDAQKMFEKGEKPDTKGE